MIYNRYQPTVCLYFAWVALLTIMTLSIAAGAAELERDEIMAQILDVNEEENKLRVRVMESGNVRRAAPGEIYEYSVQPDVRIELPYEEESALVPLTPQLSDLKNGLRVKLDLEELDRVWVVIGVRPERDDESVSGSSSTAQTTASSSRTRLPETASMWPTLALLSVPLVILAAFVHIYRRRVESLQPLVKQAEE